MFLLYGSSKSAAIQSLHSSCILHTWRALCAASSSSQSPLSSVSAYRENCARLLAPPLPKRARCGGPALGPLCGAPGGRTASLQKEIPAFGRGFLKGSKNYSSMSITTPEPTVRPPSRMAKRRPFSMAMGVISSTFMSTLSPGMHISVPSGRVMMPVTSVVRK